MLQFKLPATHSVRVPGSEVQGFSPLRLLQRAAIFCYKEDNVLQDSTLADCTSWEGADGREEPANQLLTCLERKVIEEIKKFLRWGGGTVGWDHQVGCCGFSDRGLGTRGCFLLGLPGSRLRGFCRFGLTILGHGSLPGGSHVRLLESLRKRLGREIWIRGWSGSGLDVTPAMDDGAVLATSGAYFAKAVFVSCHLLQPRYIDVWFRPQPQHWCCSR